MPGAALGMSSPVPSAGTTKDSKNPMIIGITLGILFLILFAALLYYVLCYRPTHRQSASSAFRHDMMVRPRLASLFDRHNNSAQQDRDFPSDPEKGPEYFTTTVMPSRSERPLSELAAPEFMLPYTYGASNTPGSRNARRPVSFTTTTTDTTSQFNYRNQFAPLSDRQMELEEMIYGLHVMVLGLERIGNVDRDSLALSLPGEDDLRAVKLKGQIEALRRLKDTDWALGLTDEVPAELCQLKKTSNGSQGARCIM